MQSAECRMQSVSSKKQLITVFCVANAQKQGVMQARLVLTSSTTIFQEIECKIYCQGLKSASAHAPNAEGQFSAQGVRTENKANILTSLCGEQKMT